MNSFNDVDLWKNTLQKMGSKFSVLSNFPEDPSYNQFLMRKISLLLLFIGLAFFINAQEVDYVIDNPGKKEIKKL